MSQMELLVTAQELVSRIGMSDDLSDLLKLPLSLANSISARFSNSETAELWKSASVGLPDERAAFFRSVVERGLVPNTQFVLNGLGESGYNDFRSFLSGFAKQAFELASQDKA